MGNIYIYVYIYILTASRIKELRLSRHLTQRELGDIISVTQQNISKYENNVIEVPVDVLIKIAQYFNVTTDYILGITETKRNLERQVIVNKAIDEYFEYVEIFKTLTNDEKELIWLIMLRLKEMKR